MRFSRKQLDRAGRTYIEDPFARQEAFSMISEWRETHLPVLDNFYKQITSFFASRGIQYNISSQRIKRMSSIANKLRHNPDMGLGGMQDIGGMRFVFDNISQLLAVQEELRDFSPEGFECKKQYDYVDTPKTSGYRSIHYVYKYHSDDVNYDGLSLELQIRTKLQHSWAMAVETGSLISQTSLKTNIDNEHGWREFFMVASAIFSKKEKMPVMDKFKDCSDRELCKLYFQLQKKEKFLDQLSALNISLDREFPDDSGFCVLYIDFKERKVHWISFSKDQEKEATDAFNKLESAITTDEASLMVSLEKMNEITSAYPSYFLDTKKFISAIKEFEHYCKIC